MMSTGLAEVHRKWPTGYGRLLQDCNLQCMHNSYSSEVISNNSDSEFIIGNFALNRGLTITVQINMQWSSHMNPPPPAPST